MHIPVAVRHGADRVVRAVRPQFRWLATFGTLVAAALVAIAAAFEVAKFPSEDVWVTVRPAVLILTAYVLFVGPVGNWFLDRRAQQYLVQRHLNELTHVLLLQMTILCAELTVGTICVRVWQPAGQAWNRRLVSQTRARIGEHQSSGMVWRKGQGTIGRCWETCRNQFDDLSPLHRLDVTGQDMESELARRFLTLDQYRLTERYRTVLAIPIRTSSEEFMGCIAIDCTRMDSYAQMEEALRDSRVEGTISTIETLLRAE